MPSVLSGSPTKAARRTGTGGYFDADVNCADSCSSFQEDLKDLKNYDEESGLSAWDTDSGNPTSSESDNSSSDERDDQQPRSRRWLPGWIPRGGMQTLALMCMLLTVGTIIVPRGDRGVDGLVATIAKRAQERAAHQSSAFIARLKGTRHCRPIADSSTVQRVTIGGRGAVYPMEEPKQRGQWLVPARQDGLMSILTPIYPDNATLSVLHNQLRTANKFLNMDTFKEWVFVTPEDQVEKLIDFLEEKVTVLPCLLADKIRVVSDQQCVPELHPWRFKKFARERSESFSGWTKQQLVKLACGNTIQTPFYLITDADTFFMRSMQALDLVAQGECKPDSGVCDLKKQVQFRAKNEMQPPLTEANQKEWEQSSAKALNMTMPAEQLRHMGVTPQIMSRPVLDGMQTHLATLAEGGESWRGYLLRMHLNQVNSTDPAQRSKAAWTVRPLIVIISPRLLLYVVWDAFALPDDSPTAFRLPLSLNCPSLAFGGFGLHDPTRPDPGFVIAVCR